MLKEGKDAFRTSTGARTSCKEEADIVSRHSLLKACSTKLLQGKELQAYGFSYSQRFLSVSSPSLDDFNFSFFVVWPTTVCEVGIPYYIRIDVSNGATSDSHSSLSKAWH